jgi:hypothetical protein
MQLSHRKNQTLFLGVRLFRFFKLAAVCTFAELDIKRFTLGKKSKEYPSPGKNFSRQEFTIYRKFVLLLLVIELISTNYDSYTLRTVHNEIK